MDSAIRERRRRQLIEAATAEFSRRGYDSASISAIAERAGIGKSTVYEYFPSKIDLLRAVGEQMSVQRIESIRVVLNRDAPLRDRLICYMRDMNYMRDSMSGVPYLDSSGVPDLVHKLILRFCTEVRALLVDALRRARDSGELPMDDSRIELGATVLLSVYDLTGRYRAEESDKNAALMVDFILSGLRDEKTG